MVKSQESLVDVLRREVAALNTQLQECDAIFRWHVDDKHMSVDIIPANASWLGARPCINISAEYRDYVKNAFFRSGYIIHFNNTSTIFWVSKEVDSA